MEFETQLKGLFDDRFKTQEPLAKHLNFRIGGPAAWFAEVKSVEELQESLRLATEAGVKTFVLGGGSNTLASDEGFDGLVLKMAMRNFTIKGTAVIAEAGVISAALARATAEAGLAGFTWAISLPGTIGGGVRGNAGCFGGEMKDVITKVDVLRDGEVVTIHKEDLGFGYRESHFKRHSDIVVRVYLSLTPGDKETLVAELKDKVTARKESQPLYAGSAGCIFKNYEIASPEELERLKTVLNIPESMQQSMRLSAGWLIDRADLKGKQVGDAKISEEHGNFLINLGNATASDIVMLISEVKTEIRDLYGIQLQEEVQYVGF